MRKILILILLFFLVSCRNTNSIHVNNESQRFIYSSNQIKFLSYRNDILDTIIKENSYLEYVNKENVDLDEYKKIFELVPEEEGYFVTITYQDEKIEELNMYIAIFTNNNSCVLLLKSKYTDSLSLGTQTLYTINDYYAYGIFPFNSYLSDCCFNCIYERIGLTGITDIRQDFIVDLLMNFKEFDFSFLEGNIHKNIDFYCNSSKFHGNANDEDSFYNGVGKENSSSIYYEVLEYYQYCFNIALQYFDYIVDRHCFMIDINKVPIKFNDSDYTIKNDNLYLYNPIDNYFHAYEKGINYIISPDLSVIITITFDDSEFLKEKNYDKSNKDHIKFYEKIINEGGKYIKQCVLNKSNKYVVITVNINEGLNTYSVDKLSSIIMESLVNKVSDIK